LRNMPRNTSSPLHLSQSTYPAMYESESGRIISVVCQPSDSFILDEQRTLLGEEGALLYLCHYGAVVQSWKDLFFFEPS
jgi:hypothetical protein